MLYRILHKTTYDYAEPVSLCHNLAHLTPRSDERQQCRLCRLQIDPAPAVISSQTDYFGNQCTFFTVQTQHRQLAVTASHLVEVTSTPPTGDAPRNDDSPAWDEVRDRLRNERSADLLNAVEYVYDSPYVKCDDMFAGYAAESFPAGRPLLDAVLELTARIHRDFRYDPRTTNLATPLGQVFAQKSGVCQDFSHLGIACLRSLGLPARYVSGYICTKPPPGQERLVGADATHAWLSVYCPGRGWIDFDPTNNVVPSNQHVFLAWGRDYDDVSPIKGVILGGGAHNVHVSVDVQPTDR
ncbi:MAG: transglutaminase N-terminal domain-containing protein [Gemmataceae bacterium]